VQGGKHAYSLVSAAVLRHVQSAMRSAQDLVVVTAAGRSTRLGKAAQPIEHVRCIRPSFNSNRSRWLRNQVTMASR